MSVCFRFLLILWLCILISTHLNTSAIVSTRSSASPQPTTLFKPQLAFTMYTAIFTTLVVAASLGNAVRVTSPTDDSLWQSGSSQTISWESVSTDPQQFDIQLVNQVSDGSPINWWIQARGSGRRTRLCDEVFGS